MSEQNKDFKYCPYCGEKIENASQPNDSKECDWYCISQNEGTSNDKKVLKG